MFAGRFPNFFGGQKMGMAVIAKATISSRRTTSRATPTRAFSPLCVAAVLLESNVPSALCLRSPAPTSLLSIYEFVAIIQLSGLIGANIGLNEHNVKLAFVHSRMTVPDEMEPSGAFMFLTTVEYYEAVLFRTHPTWHPGCCLHALP